MNTISNFHSQDKKVFTTEKLIGTLINYLFWSLLDVTTLLRNQKESFKQVTQTPEPKCSCVYLHLCQLQKQLPQDRSFSNC